MNAFSDIYDNDPGPMSDVLITRSRGRGRITVYIRPNFKCWNKSRKAQGHTEDEVREKASRVISKWYSPSLTLFEVDGHIIVSNTAENALKEYWRVCDKEFIGTEFLVTTIQTPHQ